MFYLKKIYRPIQSIFPKYTWRLDNADNSIYLTFDDGPCPGVTDVILTQLKAYNAKATFFCIGSNVEKYPELYQQIIDEGHAVGNHSYSHISGWKMNKADYLQDIAKAKKYIESNLFRPPYGRVRRSQGNAILDNYKIIMYDVMPGDFDNNLTPDQCYNYIIQYSSAGSIVVLHDSEKAKRTVLEILPQVLAHYTSNGYLLKSISSKS